jgi:hypothetical protein
MAWRCVQCLQERAVSYDNKRCTMRSSNAHQQIKTTVCACLPDASVQGSGARCAAPAACLDVFAVDTLPKASVLKCRAGSRTGTCRHSRQQQQQQQQQRYVHLLACTGLPQFASQYALCSMPFICMMMPYMIKTPDSKPKHWATCMATRMRGYSASALEHDGTPSGSMTLGCFSHIVLGAPVVPE